MSIRQVVADICESKTLISIKDHKLMETFTAYS